jgi:hypothetical protein
MLDSCVQSFGLHRKYWRIFAAELQIFRLVIAQESASTHPRKRRRLGRWVHAKPRANRRRTSTCCGRPATDRIETQGLAVAPCLGVSALVWLHMSAIVALSTLSLQGFKLCW